MASFSNHTGVWGPVTATLDWCEVSPGPRNPTKYMRLTLLKANYQFSPFVAEVANSFSNVITVFLGLYGVYVCLQQKLPTRYLIGFLVCLVPCLIRA